MNFLVLQLSNKRWISEEVAVVKHLGSFLIVAVLFAPLALLLSGCGGGDHCFNCGPPPLRVHFLSLYLKVADSAGDPVSRATVTLNGRASANRTQNFFRTVSGCDCSFEGFHYNWATTDFEVDIPAARDR